MTPRLNQAVPRVPTSAPPALVGSDSQMQRVRSQLRRAASLDAPVLLRGETGTGKEVAARTLVAHSDRATRPLIAVNPTALPDDVFDALMFGHRRGAYTGADREESGLVRAAHGGTLFLDEIGELTPRAQQKLVRVLRERRVTPVGGHRSEPVDFRLVAATHQPIEDLVHSGKFSVELMLELDVIRVGLPPLRERVADIPELVSHFLAHLHREGGLPAVIPPSCAALGPLYDHTWPGNVRELRNVVAMMALLAADGRVTLETVRRALRHVCPHEAASIRPHDIRPLSTTVHQTVRHALEVHHGNVAAAARALRISRVTFYKHLRASQAS